MKVLPEGQMRASTLGTCTESVPATLCSAVFVCCLSDELWWWQEPVACVGVSTMQSCLEVV